MRYLPFVVLCLSFFELCDDSHNYKQLDWTIWITRLFHLLIYLRTHGIHRIGKINRNRIKNCRFPETKIMMKMERGVSQEFIYNILKVWN